MGDPLLAELPAPQDFPLVEPGVEVDEPLVEPLEFAADPLQLAEKLVDPGGDGIHLRLERELLLRFPPLGPGLRGDELILRHEILPLRIDRHDVLHHSFHEGQGAIGLGEGEKLVGHEDNLLYHDSLHVFRPRDEPHDFLVAIQHHNRRSDMMIRWIGLLRDLETSQFGLGLNDRSVCAGMVSD